MGKRNFRQKLCASLDIEPDVLPHGSLVEIRGRERVRISGCGRILNYTQEQIRVALHKGAVCVSGEELLCSSFCRGELSVEGRIDGVCFEEDV